MGRSWAPSPPQLRSSRTTRPETLCSPRLEVIQPSDESRTKVWGPRLSFLLPCLPSHSCIPYLAHPCMSRIFATGFEGLTISPDNKKLYALVQSALVQDGGSSATKGRYTRFVGYDISNPASPVLVEEYVVTLPMASGTVFAQSEMHFVSDDAVSPTSSFHHRRDGKESCISDYGNL